MFALWLLLGDPSTEKPAALRRAEAARAASVLQTGRIEYSICDHGDLRFGVPFTQFYSWQGADERYMVTMRGDEEGVIYRVEGGLPAPPLELQKPVNLLIKDGVIWYHAEDDRGAHVLDSKRHFFEVHDLRKLGLSPVDFGSDFDRSNAELGYELRYRCESRDGLEIVTGEYPDNAHVECGLTQPRIGVSSARAPLSAPRSRRIPPSP